MNKTVLLAPLAALAMLGAGCGKKAAQGPLAPGEVPQAMENAFSQSAPDIGAEVTSAVSAVRSEDPAAFAELQRLSGRSELTPEQRDVTERSMTALLPQLRDAAAKGDKKAEETLQHYRATK